VSSDPDERAVARLLDNPAVWAEVPPGLKERVLAEALGGAPAAADDELGAPDTAAAPTDLRSRILADAEAGATRTGDDHDASEPGATPTPIRGRPRHAARRPDRPPVWQRPVLLAAAAAALVGITIGGTLVATRDEAQPTGTEVALAGTESMPAASGTVELRNEPSGVSVTLNVSGLPPAPERTFYEAWLVSEDLGKVSAGTFHVREPQDDITLWLGVDPADYDAFTVTRQPVQGGTLADGVVVLRGELP
jgi:hypothetical protein